MRILRLLIMTVAISSCRSVGGAKNGNIQPDEWNIDFQSICTIVLEYNLKNAEEKELILTALKLEEDSVLFGSFKNSYCIAHRILGEGQPMFVGVIENNGINYFFLTYSKFKGITDGNSLENMLTRYPELKSVYEDFVKNAKLGDFWKDYKALSSGRVSIRDSKVYSYAFMYY